MNLNKDLMTCGVEETTPRAIREDITESSNRGDHPKLTARIRGRPPKKGTMLASRTEKKLSQKEARKRAKREEWLEDFRKEARLLPIGMKFEEAWKEHDFLRWFYQWQEDSLSDVEELYNEAREGLPKPRTLHKLQDPGCFLVHCSIFGKKLEDCLCDSGAGVNLMPELLARELGLMDDLQPGKRMLKLADGSPSVPLGEAVDVPLSFGDCIIHCDFCVTRMKDLKDTGLLLGRAFLATAGAIMDWPNRRISLANVDKETFYSAAPPGFSSKRIRYTNEDATARVECLPLGHHLKASQQDEALPDSSRTRRAEKPPTELQA